MPESLVALERQRPAILARILLGDFRPSALSAAAATNRPAATRSWPALPRTRKVKPRPSVRPFTRPPSGAKRNAKLRLFAASGS